MFDYPRPVLIFGSSRSDGNTKKAIESVVQERHIDIHDLNEYNIGDFDYNKANEKDDFLPLTVQYIEKTYAAGKIPGGFFKREGRPNENETLISRLIDRPLRPLFPKGYYNEVQVVCTVVSLNPDIDPDILCLTETECRLENSDKKSCGRQRKNSGQPGYIRLYAHRLSILRMEIKLPPAQSSIDTRMIMTTAGALKKLKDNILCMAAPVNRP